MANLTDEEVVKARKFFNEFFSNTGHSLSQHSVVGCLAAYGQTFENQQKPFDAANLESAVSAAEKESEKLTLEVDNLQKENNALQKINKQNRDEIVIANEAVKKVIELEKELDDVRTENESLKKQLKAKLSKKSAQTDEPGE